EQDVGVAAAQRERQSLEIRIEHNAARAAVIRVDVLITAWIVKLLAAAADKNRVGSKFAEVNFRPRHLDVDAALWREVLYEEARLAIGRHLVDRIHDDAVAMGEFQIAIDPRGRG